MNGNETSSRTLASENKGAGRLSLQWLVTIPVVKLLLLHSGRLHASAAADPGSKALLGLTNYLHCRDYLFKGQNSTHPSGCGRKGSCNLSVLAIIWGVSSSSSINAHSWNLSGVLTHKELLQVLRKQLKEIYLVSVLSLLFT